MGIFDGIFGTGISTLGNLISTGLTNRQNAQLTRESWARDDTAVQRRTADLEKAGINPLLAAGQAATSSSPIPMKAPEIGDFGASLIAGKQADSQARQVNHSIEIGNKSLDNATKVANAQVLETIAKTALTTEMINQAKHNSAIAVSRKRPVGERPNEWEVWAPELSSIVKDALKDLAEKATLGTKPGLFDIPKKPEKPKGFMGFGEDGGTTPPKPKFDAKGNVRGM